VAGVAPELQPALLAYQERVTALAIRVLRALASALDQPDDLFADAAPTHQAHSLSGPRGPRQ